MGFFGKFLGGDNDEILFFILVFLFLFFNGNLFGNHGNEGCDRDDSTEILFFIILFLLLFFNNRDYECETKC